MRLTKNAGSLAVPDSESNWGVPPSKKPSNSPEFGSKSRNFFRSLWNHIFSTSLGSDKMEFLPWKRHKFSVQMKRSQQVEPLRIEAWKMIQLGLLGGKFGPILFYLEPQTTIYKWLFQLDDSQSLHRKWLFHQTSIYKWLFGVPGREVFLFGISKLHFVTANTQPIANGLHPKIASP